MISHNLVDLNIVSVDGNPTVFPFRTLVHVILFFCAEFTLKACADFSLAYTLYIRFAARIIRTRIHVLPRIGEA